VQLTGTAEVPAGRVLVISAESAGAAVPATGAPSGHAAPAPTAAPKVIAGVTEQTAQIVLSGLNQDVHAGLTYPVVLNFEHAGQITVDVPVGFPEQPRGE
jgi:hypothetical protein